MLLKSTDLKRNKKHEIINKIRTNLLIETFENQKVHEKNSITKINDKSFKQRREEYSQFLVDLGNQFFNFNSHINKQAATLEIRGKNSRSSHIKKNQGINKFQSFKQNKFSDIFLKYDLENSSDKNNHFHHVNEKEHGFVNVPQNGSLTDRVRYQNKVNEFKNIISNDINNKNNYFSVKNKVNYYDYKQIDHNKKQLDKINTNPNNKQDINENNFFYSNEIMKIEESNKRENNFYEENISSNKKIENSKYDNNNIYEKGNHNPVRSYYIENNDTKLSSKNLLEENTLKNSLAQRDILDEFSIGIGINYKNINNKIPTFQRKLSVSDKKNIHFEKSVIDKLKNQKFFNSDLNDEEYENIFCNIKLFKCELIQNQLSKNNQILEQEEEYDSNFKNFNKSSKNKSNSIFSHNFIKTNTIIQLKPVNENDEFRIELKDDDSDSDKSTIENSTDIFENANRIKSDKKEVKITYSISPKKKVFLLKNNINFDDIKNKKNKNLFSKNEIDIARISFKYLRFLASKLKIIENKSSKKNKN